MKKCPPLVLSTLCLLLLGGSLAVASTPPPPPPPPSVTVADSTLPEPPITHWDQFVTGLNATVANPPVPTDETTVDGPHFQWSCSNNPQFHMDVNDSPSDILTSDPALELSAGNNDITVTCVVTWNVTDTKTNVVTPVTCSGSTDVVFFVRVPRKMQATFRRNDKLIGPPVWGHDTFYDMTLLDNQAMPKAYTKGTVSEVFSNVQYNPKYAANLIARGNAPGTPSTGISASQIPPDENTCDNATWKNPPPSDTGDTMLWYQFDQTWHSQERGKDLSLNTYIIYHQQGKALRL